MTFLLTKPLADHLFDAFSIQRWNDRIRVIELTEMDKNAYKMMLAYFVGRVYEERKTYIDWQSLIDRGVYDLLVRISTSDIKASLHGKMREDKATYNASVSQLIEDDLGDKLPDLSIIKKVKDYIANNHKGSLSNEDLILRLCHNIAVRREYEFIENIPFNLQLPSHRSDFERYSSVIDEIDDEIRYYAERLDLVEYISSDKFQKLKYSIDQLRFQQRWSQTQRIPKTNVLGHSFYVALLCYFSTRDEFNNSMRLRNNFFSALMHDFLESYTRDVINPVKLSSEHFKAQIMEAEKEAYTKKLVPLLESCFEKHFEFLIIDEFLDRKFEASSGNVTLLTPEEKEQHGFEYADGTIVKACDSLAALIEAHQSIELGVSSKHLQGGITRVFASFTGPNPKKRPTRKDDEGWPKGMIENDTVRLGLLKVFNDYIST